MCLNVVQFAGVLEQIEYGQQYQGWSDSSVASKVCAK